MIKLEWIRKSVCEWWTKKKVKKETKKYLNLIISLTSTLTSREAGGRRLGYRLRGMSYMPVSNKETVER